MADLDMASQSFERMMKWLGIFFTLTVCFQQFSVDGFSPSFLVRLLKSFLSP